MLNKKKDVAAYYVFLKIGSVRLSRFWQFFFSSNIAKLAYTEESSNQEKNTKPND